MVNKEHISGNKIKNSVSIKHNSVSIKHDSVSTKNWKTETMETIGNIKNGILFPA